MRFAVLRSAFAAALMLLSPTGAGAADKAVAIELNKATDAGGGCREGRPCDDIIGPHLE